MYWIIIIFLNQEQKASCERNSCKAYRTVRQLSADFVKQMSQNNKNNGYLD